MNVWKVIFATFVIFGTGVVTGALVMSQIHRNNPPPVTHSPASNTAPLTTTHALWPSSPVHVAASNTPPRAVTWNIMKTNYLAEISKQLDLTDTQRANIEQIITDGQKRTKSISDTISPQLREITKETRAKIISELTPEQREKYEQLSRPQQRKTEKKKPAPGTSKPTRMPSNRTQPDPSG